MTPARQFTPQMADDARRRILNAVLQERHPAVLVDSPPGAGKTNLVEAVVATAVAHEGLRVAVLTPRVEQANDLARRIRNDYQPFETVLLHSEERAPPADVMAAGVSALTKADRLPTGPSLVIATAKKMQMAVTKLEDGRFDLIVFDEAYQLPWKEMAPILQLGRRVLLVGDPGQLPPLVRADVARFEGAASKVHWAAPRELLRLHPDLPRIPLPATFRLPQDTVDFVQPAFYPELPFVSGAAELERKVSFATAGMNGPIDRALDQLAGGATMVGLLLPERRIEAEDVDEELAELAADVLARLLERGVQWDGRGPLAGSDLGYVDAHVASNAAVERRLRRRGIGSDTWTTTPEIWQGLQRPIMVMKHTLSGVRRFDGFSLEPGRLCVMSSRHQLGCIIVGRDGVGRALEDHQHDCAQRPSGAEDLAWSGWRAHRTLWSMLEDKGRLVRV